MATNTTKLKLPVTKTHNTQYIYNVLHNIEPVAIDYSYGVSQKYGLTLSRGFSYMVGAVYIDEEITIDTTTRLLVQTLDLTKSEVFDIKDINGLYYLTVKILAQLIVNNQIVYEYRNFLISTCNFCDYKYVDMYCNCNKAYNFGCGQVTYTGTNEIVITNSFEPKYSDIIFSSATNYKAGDNELLQGYSSSIIVSEDIPANIGEYIFIEENSGGITSGQSLLIVGKSYTGGAITLYFSQAILGTDIGNAAGRAILYKDLDYNKHININTCSGVNTYTKNKVIENPTFNGCYKDIKKYQGGNGAEYFVTFDENKGVIQTSLQGDQYMFGDYQPIAAGTKDIIMYGNFILYGSDKFIGASYISEVQLDGSSTPVINGNIIRDNIGFHTNPDGRITAYDTYGNSFYFLGDTGINRRIYSLGLNITNAGYINSEIKDMTDEAWLLDKEKELDEITPNDYVNIQANDTQFNIIINYSDNHSNVPQHTKILTYWKDYKIRTTRKICNAIITRITYYKGNEVRYGKSGLYKRCGIKDTIRYNNQDGTYTDSFQKILANINVCLFDDGHRVYGGAEGRDSFSKHTLTRIITQLSGRYTKNYGIINLNINAYDNLWRVKTFDGFSSNDSLDRYATNNKTEYTMSKCLLDQLDNCEEYRDDELYSPIDYHYDVGQDCFCPKRKPYLDLCIEHNNHKKYLSPIVNIHSPIGMTSNVFDVSFQFTEDLVFYGWLIEYENEGLENIDAVSDCSIVGCNNCEKTQPCCYNEENAILCK